LAAVVDLAAAVAVNAELKKQPSYQSKKLTWRNGVERKVKRKVLLLAFTELVLLVTVKVSMRVTNGDLGRMHRIHLSHLWRFGSDFR
jgi:hypothetical protein